MMNLKSNRLFLLVSVFLYTIGLAVVFYTEQFHLLPIYVLGGGIIGMLLVMNWRTENQFRIGQRNSDSLYEQYVVQALQEAEKAEAELKTFRESQKKMMTELHEKYGRLLIPEDEHLEIEEDPILNPK